MINTMAALIDAWYSLLNGHIVVNSVAIPVYQEDAPSLTTGHYVLLRAESETSKNNKRSFADSSVVIVDIVTIFINNIDRSVVDNIDGQIGALILTDPETNGLSPQSGFQILNVNRETSTYIPEEDNSYKYYRKVSRYNHLIYQTA